MQIKILGCGSSPGVPSVGNRWGLCNPKNKKNRRSRTSIFISDDKTNILVDTSPDLRSQLIKNNIDRAEYLIYTHHHADHLNGIDDIRGLNRVMKAPINMYAPKSVLEHIKNNFSYILEPLKRSSENEIYKPWVNYKKVTDKEVFYINKIKITPIRLYHGINKKLKSMGYIFNNIAYITDFTSFIDTDFAYKYLKNIDLLIIGVIGFKPHNTHMHVQGALDIIKETNAKEAIFTHMGAGLDYQEWEQKTPKNVKLAYDGMIINI